MPVFDLKIHIAALNIISDIVQLLIKKISLEILIITKKEIDNP